ncbi:MAG: MFS transporter [Gemmatimonadetes bacterium]|mgnify:CR=1 FL=1|nr:MFS transporter [Gemmatimonadota bacterium]MBT6148606.1 MFS transporter [Gemmatimonadota bacterium]MBT7863270.1 MFS transporter [Gemmatimonadota bacterium]
MFYGWIIVAAGFAIQLLNGGLLFHAFSAYVLPLQAEFGWSRTILASAFALLRMESGILGPLQGWLIDRFGPRPVMSVGNTLFAIGFLLFSRVDSLTSFYVALAIIALGSSLGGFMPIATTVTQWFARRRSTALGLTLAGMGTGGLLIPVVVYLIQHQGWRWMAVLSAILIAVIAIPASQLMRRRPEDYGQRPDGDPISPGHETQGANREPNFTASQALRTPTFWFLSLVHASALLIVGTVLVHQIPHMVESMGLSQPVAGSVVALLVVVVIGGQLLGGLLGERVDKRLIIFVAMWMHAAAMVILAYATTLTGAILFAVLHGIAWGARGTIINSIRAEYFGRRAYAKVSGFSSLLIMIGMTSGPLFAGVIRDVTGSYRDAFLTLAAFGALASFAALAARPPMSRIASDSEL